MADVEIITIPNYDSLNDIEKQSVKITTKTYVDRDDAIDLRDMYIKAGYFKDDTDHKIVMSSDKNLVHLMNQHFSLGMVIVFINGFVI